MPLDAQPQAPGNAGQPSWMAPLTPVIPDHELVRRIGGGSYGDVWLARTTVGTWRAVKVVFRDRFTDRRPYEREFHGIQRFEPLSRGNEAFVDILQIGRNDAEGYFYYVMELADDATAAGGSVPFPVSSVPPAGAGASVDSSLNTEHLKQDTSSYVPKTLSKVLLQRGRLPVAECVELGLTLNLGLAHLHRAGLIHRDIKPSNIIFVGGVPKLADIGLVIEQSEARSFVGTEGFIPPEGPNSAQADLYSLGKVLYEAGMGKDRKDFPEPLTQLGEAPDSPQLLEFNAILLQACAANREERYRSAEEMNADLALLQSGGSVRRQRKAARQLRFVQRAGLLVSVVAAIIATGWWWQARQTRLVRQMATEKADLAENLSLLDRENRDRIVRLDIANGIQLLDQADHAGALVWLADALMRLTNKPAEEAVQRIRIGQALNHIPRLLRVFGHSNGVLSVAFSPDGRRLATGTADGASVWDAATGARQLQWTGVGGPIREVRFADDGRKLFVSSCAPEGHVRSPTAPGFAAVLDAAAGSEVFPPLTNVYPAALSPDDRWLVVARTNHTLHVLDAVTGQLHAELAGHASQIITLAFSRDGRLFASGDRDQKVRLWTLPSGAPAGPPIRLGQSLGRMALSPDGRRLVTRTAPGRGESHLIRTWNVGTGREIARPLVATPILNPLTFDPTGRRIITAELPPTLIVLDADSHVRLATLPHFRTMPHCWSFSPDGARFAVGSESGMAWVWDLESGAALTPGLHHHGPVESVQFSPDGSLLLTGGEDGLARLWDLATLEEAARPLDLPGSVVPLQPDLFPHAVSPDGRHLLLPMETGVPSVDLSTLRIEGEPMRAPRGTWPYQMEFAADGSQWAVLTAIDQPADLPYQVRLWRTLGDRVEALALSHPRPVDAIGFSADGARLFSVTDDGLFWNWQAADAGLPKTDRLPTGYYLTLAIGPDGRHIVVQTKDGDVVLAPLGEPGKSPVRLGGDSLRAARFSPKGDRLAVVGSDPVGRVWNVETGQSIAAFRHGQNLMWIEWSPEGDRFVTAGPGMVRIWDARTGEALFTPMEHRLAARTARFSPDGRFLVTVCDDGTVRVWDAHNAEPVTAPLDQRTPKPRAAFLTASGRLATVSDPAVVRTWMLEPSALPAVALSEIARWLSGRKLGSTGTVGDLQSDELSELAAALERNHPELLARAPSRIAEWHWRQVREPTSLRRVTAGLFHLRQLRELTPGEPGLEEQGLRLGRCLPPPRDPTSSSNLLDLSGFYTHSFGVLPRQEFADLPTGVQTFGGIPFDVRGLIRLQPLNSEFTLASLPLLAVSGIPVDRPSRQLHFLLGLDGAQAVEGDEVARWEIHQADGSVHLWPVVLGQQVGNTWNGDGVPAVVGQAVVAWEGHSPVARMAGADSLRLFKATWVNPRPEVAIRELEFTLGTANVRPFVIAITAD